MNAHSSNTGRRPSISAAVICYNEERNIARCLRSLDWCEQVVVVDSGSTDGTIEIVRSFPAATVVHRPFDDFVNQKNFALDQCEHDWVLSLDADESLTAPLVDEIQRLRFDAEGYRISRRPFLGEQEIKHGTWNPDYTLRLFRKSCGRWGGLNPHCHVILQGRARPLRSRMLHLSYRDRQEFLDRSHRYVLMAVESLTQEGRKTNGATPYLHWIGNFLKAYVLRAGFLDGSTGLFLAYHIANGSFLKYRLLAQRRRELRRSA